MSSNQTASKNEVSVSRLGEVIHVPESYYIRPKAKQSRSRSYASLAAAQNALQNFALEVELEIVKLPASVMIERNGVLECLPLK